jgi:GNAT superfamily N-acetyltransferase
MAIALSTTESHSRQTRDLNATGRSVKTIPSAQRDFWHDLLQRAFTRSAGNLYKRPNFFHDYVTHDPHFKRKHLLGLYRDGRLISTCQVFTRTLAIGAHRFSLHGLGNIATDPKFQGQGLGSGLLRWFIKHPTGQRDLSILYTGAPGFYARLGWQPKTARSLHIGRTSMWRSAAMPGVRLRRMKPRDRAAVAGIYAEFNKRHDIPHIVRSGRYWDDWIMRWKLKIYGLTAEVIVDRDGALLGYMFLAMRGDRMTVEEYGAVPDMLDRVAQAILRKFERCERASRLVFLCATAPLEQALSAMKIPFELLCTSHASERIYLFNQSLQPWRDKICLWHVDHF